MLDASQTHVWLGEDASWHFPGWQSLSGMPCARRPPCLQENANRLKAYKANLVLFPRRANKPKAGDSSAEELKAVAQLKGALLPITAAKPALEKVAVTADMKKERAYATLRVERMNARLAGMRAKRAAEEAAAAKDAA